MEKISINEAFHRGVSAHGAGKLVEADKFYTAILKVDPEHVDTINKLACLAIAAGNLEKSNELFERAIALKPDREEGWTLYIKALVTQAKYEKALGTIKRAKEIFLNESGLDELERKIMAKRSQRIERPSVKQSDIAQLTRLIQSGQYAKVVKKGVKLLEKGASSALLHNLIASSNLYLGQNSEAHHHVSRALIIEPDFGPALNNMAIVYLRNQQSDNAINTYQKLEKQREFREIACRGLASIFQKIGNAEQAIIYHLKVIEMNKDSSDSYRDLSILLKQATVSSENIWLEKVILKILNMPNVVKPSDISTCAISLIKSRNTLKRLLSVDVNLKDRQQILEIAEVLSDCPLLIELMALTPVNDLELEVLFKTLRRYYLFNFADQKGETKIRKLRIALARQCYLNEFIYGATEVEQEQAEKLRSHVLEQIESDSEPDCGMMMALASYNSVYDFLARITNIGRLGIDEIIDQQFTEPNIERQLRKNIASIGSILDEGSSIVRTQYEENPYPRWTKLQLNTADVKLRDIFSEVPLKLVDDGILSEDKKEVLVAGCGTGQESIQTSGLFKGSNITAIDLSLSSLAYAKRKSTELGIKNISYYHCDILNAQQLNLEFDIISCSGVLHHMMHPLKGWRTLTQILKPGGLMKIGLYSRIARKDIPQLRNGNQAIGSKLIKSDLINYRENLLASQSETLNTLSNLHDFYSVSMFRDLIFNEVEHRYDLLEIRDTLEDLDLEFCGFQISPKVQIKFKNEYSDNIFDLGKWHEFEHENRDTFKAMYQFWCQKRVHHN